MFGPILAVLTVLLLASIEGVPERAIEVEFSHRAHIENVGMECLDCHSGILVSDRPSHTFPKMEDCVNCHRPAGNALSECGLCHPPESELRPANHLITDFFDEHSSELTDIDRQKCRMCHTPGFNPCTQCH